MTIKYLYIYSTLGRNIEQISIYEALTCTRVKPFQHEFLEAEHMLEVFKIEHDKIWGLIGCTHLAQPSSTDAKD